MNELNKDINKRVNICYSKIKQAKKELKKIRNNECSHLKIQKGLWNAGNGHIIEDCEICQICGKLINTPQYNNYTITTND